MMMKTIKKFAVGCIAFAALCASPMALAEVITYNLGWSGSSFGNGASATGHITIDTNVLPQAFIQDYLPLSNVLGLSVTVQGASAGNGTFGIGDFSAIYFTAPGTLDLHHELIGQTVGGHIYGTSDSFSGDFNLFRATSSAPTGIFYFSLQTAGGEQMLVTSINPVPEPETYAMLLAGLGLLGFTARRRTAK